MRLVIEIPDGYDVSKIQNGSIASKKIMDAVKNGTPLPKGHGRLIDADWIKNAINNRFIELALDSTPTIIEADKTESRDKK